MLVPVRGRGHALLMVQTEFYVVMREEEPCYLSALNLWKWTVAEAQTFETYHEAANVIPAGSSGRPVRHSGISDPARSAL